MCYDQHAIKIVLRLILVSLYYITLTTRIKNGTVFIFTSRSCKIDNIKKDLQGPTPCSCEEGIIYSINVAIANLTLPTFSVFTLDDYTIISTHWKKYKWRFENLVISLNVTDDNQKKALFLNYIGEEAYDWQKFEHSS